MRRSKPGITPIGEWIPANRGFYDRFLAWLQEGGYCGSSLRQYAIGARLFLGLVAKPYWMIDIDADVEAFRAYLNQEIPNEASSAIYHKVTRKLVEYLRLICHKPAPSWQPNWDHHLAGLPSWLAGDLQSYLRHQARSWQPEMLPRNMVAAMSRATLFPRYLAALRPLNSPTDLTPEAWYDYVDERLAAGIKPDTLNDQLLVLQEFLRFIAEQGREVCERTLKLALLPHSERMPRDLPPESLRRLLGEIEDLARSDHAGLRRTAMLDRAWFLLMLHCGLRTGEVRRLRTSDLDLERKAVRIEQSKGLKDRTVYLSPGATGAVQAYLHLRGPSQSEHLLLYRHLPLSPSYCSHRLRTYGRYCGVLVSPHQLRHSCATLLLNAGAPILTVQAILGHKHVTTTLGYARLYDGTVAADYYRAMAEVERKTQIGSAEPIAMPAKGQMLAMVESLSAGTLNEAQRKTVQALRVAIVELIDQEATPA